jgi:hypothetical protein
VTYTLVQKSAAPVSPTTGIAVPTLPAGSTLHNLLILKVVASGWSLSSTPTPPVGWVLAVDSGTSTTARSLIWYYPDCPGAVSSVSVSNMAGGGIGAAYVYLEEFHDDAGTNTSPLDVVGSINTDVATPVPITTSGPAIAPNVLAVSAFSGYYSSATKDTITAGSGFTQASQANNATKTSGHAVFDYMLNTNGTVTDLVTFTGPFSNAAGAIATFAVYVAPGPAPSETIVQSFEGGSSSATITTGDTQASGDTHFNSVAGSPVYDTAQAAHGTKAAKFTTSGQTLTWAPGTASQVWFRAYCYFTANPSGSSVTIVNPGVAVGSVQVDTSGIIYINAGGSPTAMATPLPLNAWFRLEGYWNVTVNTAAELKIFTSVDSTTAAETKSPSAGGNTTKPFNMTFGSPTAVGTFWMDDLGWSNQAYIGPVGAPASGVAFDAVGPAGGLGNYDTTGTAGSYAHVNNGNAILVGLTSTTGTVNQVTSCTYGGVALNFLGFITAGTGGGCAIYGLVSGSLPTGSNNVVWASAAATTCAGSLSFTAAGSFGALFTGINANGLSVTGNVTGTTIGGIIAAFSSFGGGGGSQAMSASSPGTTRVNCVGDASGPANNLAGGTWASPGGTQAVGFSSTGVADTWAMAAVEVIPAAGASILPQQAKHRTPLLTSYAAPATAAYRS